MQGIQVWSLVWSDPGPGPLIPGPTKPGHNSWASALEPTFHKRSLRNKKPAHCSQEQSLLLETTQSLRAGNEYLEQPKVKNKNLLILFGHNVSL